MSDGQSRLRGIVERAGPNNRWDASSEGRENAQWHAEDEDGDARYIYKYLCRRRGWRAGKEATGGLKLPIWGVTADDILANELPGRSEVPTSHSGMVGYILQVLWPVRVQ